MFRDLPLSLKVLVCALVALAVALVVALVAFWLEQYIRDPSVQFWLQIFAGNWSPEPVTGSWSPDRPPSSTYLFALSAVMAVVLNNGLIIAVLLYAWRQVLKRRRLIMELAAAFIAKEEATKVALVELLSENQDDIDPRALELINKGFDAGDKIWWDHLVAAFGEEDAREFFRVLGREIPAAYFEGQIKSEDRKEGYASEGQ